MSKENKKCGIENDLKELERFVIEDIFTQIEHLMKKMGLGLRKLDKSFVRNNNEVYNSVLEYARKQDFTRTPSRCKTESLKSMVKLLNSAYQIKSTTSLECENVKFGLSEYNNEITLSILWECRGVYSGKRVSIGLNFENELLTVISDETGRLDIGISDLGNVEDIIKR